MGGKDHSSARYVFTKLMPIINKIIRKEDNNILEYMYEDKTQIEPIHFLPIIPICLINGVEGIGTGFSTFIPNYKFEDIKDWYINRLKKNKNSKLIPYYNNFTGKIFIKLW